MRRAIRLNGFMPQLGYHRTNAAATHAAAGGEPYAATAAKRALGLYRSTLLSSNPLLRLIGITVNCRLRRHIESNILPSMEWSTKDIMCRPTAAVKARYNLMVRDSNPRHGDGLVANRLFHLRNNPVARALIIHLLRPSATT